MLNNITSFVGSTVNSTKAAWAAEGMLLPCRMFGRACQYYLLYSLWESAISNLLAVETLRHGTNPLNFCSIQFQGLDPEAGAKKGGETKFIERLGDGEHSSREDCINHVFVMKDIKWGEEGNNSNKDNHTLSRKLTNYLEKFIGARAYVFISTVSIFPRTGNATMNKAWDTAAYIAAGISTLITPTLKFHYDTAEIPSKFELDPSARNQAYRTAENISPWRLGITGSLISGLNGNIINRIKNAPLKPILGAIQLITAVGLTLAIFSPAALPALAIPGLVLLSASAKSYLVAAAVFAVYMTTF